MNQGFKFLSLILLLVLVIPALAGGNIVSNSGMKDLNGDHLPDKWVGESLHPDDRAVCHTQCWWRFSADEGYRSLTQTINTTLPTYTDIKLIFVVQASQIPLNASIEIDVVQGGVVVEQCYTGIVPMTGKQVTTFRVAKPPDSIRVKINTPGGLEWKIRGVKIKP